MQIIGIVVIAFILGSILLVIVCNEEDVSEPFDGERVRQELEGKGITRLYIVGGEGSMGVYGLTIEAFEVVSRIAEDTMEKVCCTFEMSNDFYRIEGICICCYKYYKKKGWKLEQADMEVVTADGLWEFAQDKWKGELEPLNYFVYAGGRVVSNLTYRLGREDRTF